MKKEIILVVISGLLIILFGYTAMSKLGDYATFKFQLGQSPITSDWAGFIAWSLPAGELLVVLLLILNRTRLLGLYASLFLMTLFTAYIYIMLNYSYHIPCSCGGIVALLSWNAHLWFNIGFIILSIIGILVETAPIEHPEKRTAITQKTLLTT